MTGGGISLPRTNGLQYDCICQCLKEVMQIFTIYQTYQLNTHYIAHLILPDYISFLISIGITRKRNLLSQGHAGNGETVRRNPE
jgi:hypothetical protein